MAVADDTLRSLRFRREREDSWRRLEQLLKKAERGSTRGLSDEDMLAIPSLYRAALSSLSVARATSLDAALVEYLEALCARAYFFVYGARSTLWQRVGRFFARDWPLAVQAMWRETLVTILLTLAGAAAGFALVWNDMDWFRNFVPDGFIGDPSASTEELRKSLYHPVDIKDGLSVFATMLFTHNAQISITAFALGFAFCVPSAMLMITNGLTMGAIVGLFAKHGLALQLGGWMLIHGVTELLAIFIAGAAGIRIGWAIAFPGALSRLGAAERAGRQGGAAMLGVVIMLICAGLLEGFGRQMIMEDWARWSIAGGTCLLWLLYFYLPRRPDHG